MRRLAFLLLFACPALGQVQGLRIPIVVGAAPSSCQPGLLYVDVVNKKMYFGSNDLSCTATGFATKSAVWNDLGPISGDDLISTILNPSSAVKLTRFSCGVTGTTSVVINLVSGGNSLLADQTCTAGDINTVNTITWANGSSQCGATSSCAVAAHIPVTVHVGTISGTPTSVMVSVDYTVSQ